MVVVGSAGVAIVGRYQELFYAGHSWFQPSLQWTHCRTLVSPSAMGRHLWENLGEKGQEQVEDLRVELKYNLYAENYLSMDVLRVWEGRGQG